MARIRSGDTEPELLVRRVLHAHGYRFRLRVRHLPGKPDIVLPKHRMVVLVHGCFWHQHRRCRDGSRIPSSNVGYWAQKLARNVERDRQNRRLLRKLGWKVVTVWECDIRRDPLLALRRSGVGL
jgi:DNA mismatch endonuclease (patch repair protein)